MYNSVPVMVVPVPAVWSAFPHVPRSRISIVPNSLSNDTRPIFDVAKVLEGLESSTLVWPDKK